MISAKKRITIMIDSDLDQFLRNLQARRIIKSRGAVSFSKVINDTIRAYFKKGVKV